MDPSICDGDLGYAPDSILEPGGGWQGSHAVDGCLYRAYYDLFWWPYAWIDVFVTGGIAPLCRDYYLFYANFGLAHAADRLHLAQQVGRSKLYLFYIFQAPLWHYWQESTNHLRHVPTDKNFVAIWQFVVFVPVLVLVSLITRRFVESAFRGCLSNVRLLPVVQENENIWKESG